MEIASVFFSVSRRSSAVKQYNNGSYFPSASVQLNW